ncbi:MAG: hypothetical protein ILO53_03600 [Clostridia bacterium]|nr:hypothetical protein [Clostridia bacterium]
MMLNFKCPNCGADVNVEETKEVVFCEACGTRIAVAEVTGSAAQALPEVTVDDNSAAAPTAPAAPAADIPLPQSKEEAVAAYERGDVEAAYRALSALSGDARDNWEINLYKGLAAAALSKPLALRINEGVTAVKNGAVAGYNGADKKDILSDYSAKVAAFAREYYQANCVKEKDFVFPDNAAAKDHFDALHQITEYLEAVGDLYNDEILKAYPELEDEKKAVIRDNLEYAAVLAKPVVYLVGFKNTTDKHGQVVAKRVEEKMKSPFESKVRTLGEKLKASYNNLPSTLSQIKKFDEELEANNKIVSEYKKSLDEHLSQNPEDGKVYRRWRLFVKKKTIAEVESRFPQELIDKKSAAARSEAAVTRLTVEKKKFIKENTI